MFKTTKGATRTRIAQAVLLLAGLSAWPVAQAQTAADPNAPAGRKPVVDTAGNGASVVHIAPANGSGVSHNLFNQLNVGAPGLVLNNATGATGTQLAGTIGGNVLFGGSPAAQARLIVSEVTSAAASTLSGGIEVAGQRADVVIANPNGISCNGCGFINTNRASLVSGRPLVGATLDGFSVTGGTVAIGAGGLNGSSLTSLDLIGGAVRVDGNVDLPAGNSAIYAVAGPNQVNYATLASTPQARAGAAPAVSIDIGAAVGMRANQIYLLANENGPGVNVRGRVEAGSGGLTLDAAGNLSFSGTLKASGGGAVVASSAGVSATGSVDASGLALVQSAGGLSWSGGAIKGSDVMLASSGALIAADVAAQASGDVRLNSGGDLTLWAGSLKAGGSVAATAVGDLTFSPTSSASRVYEGSTTRDITRYTRSTVDAGGSVALQSTAGIVTLDGAQVQAGGSIAVQGNGVALLARKDLTKETTVNGNTTLMPTTENLVQARLVAGGDVALLASGTGTDQGKLFVTGAKIESSNGHVSLLAARDLDVAHDITTDTTYERFYEVKRGWFSKKVTDITKTTLAETANPSDISGRSVSLGAGGNLNVVGSLIMADGAVGLHADQDLNLLATQEASYAYESRAVKKSGIFGNGGLSITIGSKSRTDITQSQETRQASTSVGSLAGDVLATAGGSYLQLSSDITAPLGDVHVAAQNVTLQSNNNTRSVLNIIRERQSGLTLAASSSLVSAVQTVDEMARVAKRTQSGRYQAMALLTSGLTVYNNYTSFANLLQANTLSGAATAGGWSFSASIGASASDFESLSKTSTPVESSINAGRNVSLTATGSGELGDINLIGSRVIASENLTLRAARDVTLAAAVGRDTEQTKRTSSSASIGISVGANSGGAGVNLNLAASRSNAWSNGWGTTFFNSELTAGKRLDVSSGRDWALNGAKATGETVVARVGTSGSGNLTLASPQDESFYQAREQSYGINVSIPIYGGGSAPPSLGLNASQLKLLAEYESIKQQSAIVAGTGGFDVRVNGHTHLKGSAVASKAASNYFETQTFTHEDVVNRDVASGRSWSVGLTISGASPINPADNKPYFKDAKPGMGGSAVGYARLNTYETFTTRSSIAGGVNLTRPDLQAVKVNAERAPLEAQRNSKQAQLDDLLAHEPPPCNGCGYSDPQAVPVPRDELQLQTSSTEASSPKLRISGASIAIAKPVLGGDGSASQAGWDPIGYNPDWVAWQQAVQTLRDEISTLVGRISAIDARNLDRSTLSTSPSGLHQPLLHTFDKNKATQELRDGVAVTAAFGKAAYKAAGDYAKNQFDYVVLTQCGGEPKGCSAADPWSEGGRYRAALHAAIGGIAFGTPGATGNIAGSLALNAMDRVVTSLGITDPAAINTLKNLAVTVAGAGAGNAAGMAAAFNADANNRQLHPDVQSFVKDAARIRRYMAQHPGMSYAQAEQELVRTAAVLNGADWARIHGDSATESARNFLLAESTGLLLSDGSTYFTPSEKDFNDAKKFLVEAWKGDVFNLSPELLRYRPDFATGLKGMGAGSLDGLLSYIKQTWNDFVGIPDSVKALRDALERAKLDPAAAAAAVEVALSKAGPELRRAYEENQAMGRLLELQGDAKGASQAATFGALMVFDPTGKLLKGAKLSGKIAEYVAKALEHSKALKTFDNLVGTTLDMPSLSAVARNNGMLAEGLAAQLSKEFGVDVKVLQNASGHGVDLYAFDATMNRYIVIEVKSSTTGRFGSVPAGTPSDFLEDRAAKAAAGQGFWNVNNVPSATRDAAKDITTNFQNNRATGTPPTVIGYKLEISLPKVGESGRPTVTVKRW